MKKIVAFLSFIISIFSILLVSFQTYAFSTLEFTHTSNVAIVSIYSSYGSSTSSNSSSFGDLGHSFLTIENIAPHSIYIGGYKLTSKNSLSIGTWQKNKNNGVWYNIEARSPSTFYDNASIECYVNRFVLEDLNAYIFEHNYWSIFDNCSTFAVGAWNIVSENKLDAGTINTPKNLKNLILTYSTCKINKVIKYNSNVGYLNNKSFIQAECD